MLSKVYKIGFNRYVSKKLGTGDATLSKEALWKELALSGMLAGTPAIASGAKSFKDALTSRTMSEALWKQYKNLRKAKKINSAPKKFTLPGKVIETGNKAPVSKTKAVAASSPKIDNRNLIDKSIDAYKDFEQSTGLRISKDNIRKRLGGGELAISSKGNISGKYDLGPVSVSGSPKGLDTISGRIGNLKGFVNPNKKKIGLNWGINF